MKYQRLLSAGATAIAAAILVGCTPALPGGPSEPAPVEPSPSLSLIPSEAPEPTPSATPEMLATPSLSHALDLTVWDAGAVRAKHGCGCTVEGFEGELYPEGTPIWTLRFVATSGMNNAATLPGYPDAMDLSKVTISPSWGPGRPPVVVAEEGRASAQRDGNMFGFDEAVAAGELPWKERREFVVSYYVPLDVADLTFKVRYPDKKDTYYDYTLKAKLTVDAATLLYTLP